MTDQPIADRSNPQAMSKTFEEWAAIQNWEVHASRGYRKIAEVAWHDGRIEGEKAATAAAQEEIAELRELGPCGKHVRANWIDPSPYAHMQPPFCLACAELRAKDEEWEQACAVAFGAFSHDSTEGSIEQAVIKYHKSAEDVAETLRAKDEEIARLVLEARLREMVALPIHAWPADSRRPYPLEWGIELVQYRNKKIGELEKLIADLTAQAGKEKS